MKVRVLLVDTNDEARASLTQRLRRNEDVELLGQARDAKEAGTILKRTQPDVVLVDFHQTDGQQTELCRGIRTLTSAPVAVLASFMTQDQQQDLRLAGATDFLLKHIDSKQLGRALDEMGTRYRTQPMPRGS